MNVLWLVLFWGGGGGEEVDPQKYVDLVFTRYYKKGLIVFVCAYMSVGIG